LGKFPKIPTVTFAPTPHGQSVDVTISRTNTSKGLVSGTIGAPANVSPPNSVPFFTLLTPNPNSHFSVLPGKTLTITIRFTPPFAAKKPFTANLPITVDQLGKTIQVKLSGKGT
jgi:hypothetical protein